MIRAILLGCGERGRIYEKYMRSRSCDFEIAAMADRDRKDADFRDWRDALENTEGVDAAIVALPDSEHFEAGKAALAKGLAVLMEKPLARSPEECEDLRETLKKSSGFLMPCYVLRYSNHYRKLAEILSSGAIGEVMSIYHLNAVGYRKTAANFCRGNWGKTAESGPMILTKCSHDLDLICLWKRYEEPKRIASFGGGRFFSPKNAPAGVGEKCVDCKEVKCIFRDGVEKCVFKTGADVANHQITVLGYADGSDVTFEMEAISAKRGRFTRFYGTKGTLLSDDADDQKIVLRVYGEEEAVFDTSSALHHGGGDGEVLEDFRRKVEKGVGAEEAMEMFDNAALSHHLAFIAERERKKNEIA